MGGRRASWSVGRVLCTRFRGPAVIHLGLPLPAVSCGLPAGSGGPPSNVRAGLALPGPLDLAPGGVYRAAAVTCGAGGLLHHRFTLTAAPGALPRSSGGLFSVALSRGSPRVGVTDHPALRSPDLPRRFRRTETDATARPTRSPLTTNSKPSPARVTNPRLAPIFRSRAPHPTASWAPYGRPGSVVGAMLLYRRPAHRVVLGWMGGFSAILRKTLPSVMVEGRPAGFSCPVSGLLSISSHSGARGAPGRQPEGHVYLGVLLSRVRDRGCGSCDRSPRTGVPWSEAPNRAVNRPVPKPGQPCRPLGSPDHRRPLPYRRGGDLEQAAPRPASACGPAGSFTASTTRAGQPGGRCR
jgi:hypothetical protein